MKTAGIFLDLCNNNNDWCKDIISAYLRDNLDFKA